ncbi:phosphodiester glycosidase family protein [Metabacillus arenae]|uniref:Phosphodiester glycosidase family protein n=1 Tax=Metabacillus arenae TaxID=2771434 RepID=A0A926NJ70_9BACI|nr:phosphodiester glycosidase family protein [Metabacillus arenae]MBD1382331.1 phosphodiester glycosidase family protein [Metabacillus arenae]
MKRFWLIWVVTVALFTSLFTPFAMAAPPAAKFDRSPVEDKQAPISSKKDEPQTVLNEESGSTLVTNLQKTTIGKGVELTTFERFDARGWLNGEILKVDLGNKAVSADLLHPGHVSSAEPLSFAAKRNGAIAGVNGDFFDINGTKAPIGAEIEKGKLIKGANPGREQSAGVSTEGIGQLASIMLAGTVSFQSSQHSLAALNQSSIPANGIGLFTPLWGKASRSAAVFNSKSVYEIIVKNGKVIEAKEEIGTGSIEENTLVLVGREEGAAKLKQLNVGDEVSIQYEPKASNGKPFQFAIGGNPVLVKDGEVQTLDDQVTAPRTAVGYSKDGKEMYLVTVDGRQTSSRGMTLQEMGHLMKEFGSYHSLNLDGGGSTTMLARTPGEEDPKVVNVPSDGHERPVPNGIGIYTEKGNGKLTGLNVFTQTQLENAIRVFPGLTRKFTAKGYDDAYDPIETKEIKWKTYPSKFGTFAKDGVFTAEKPGRANAEASVKGVKGISRVHVLNQLDRIESNKSRLGLAEGANDEFFVTGYDGNGYSAPIEPQDVSLSYDQSVIKIEQTEAGNFLVTPKVKEGSALVTMTVNGKEAYLPVTIGLKTETVSEMEDLSKWSFSSARGSGTIEPAEGRNKNGVKVKFDFTQSTGTRTANVHPAEPIKLPGEPQSISVWVKGDGKGEWMSFTTKGADGRYHYLYGPYVTWTGWKQVEIAVPSGVVYPLELRTIGAIETNKSKQYNGELIYDDLTVKVSPTVDVPTSAKTKDSFILQNDEIGKERWKFAILADSQFVGRSPNSQQVKIARESLQQIVKEKPEFLVIGGDFVDTAYPEDFALAKKILDEEVGDRFPIYYVPGNHEIMGTGNLDNFKKSFGQNRYSFAHKGTQFVLLDSSSGSFRTSDFQQLVELRKTIDKAMKDPEIRNLVVFGHHPTRDPLSTKNSQLSDRKEAELIESWLTVFREMSGGKGAMYISGHAHTVNMERVDGVPYMVVGPAGKAPYGAADNGGFYSWTMFGVQPNARLQPSISGVNNGQTNWITAKVNPLLESITIDAPSTIASGEITEVKATGHQPAGLNFPLRYPASVTWTGSENVFIGSGEAANKALESKKYDAVFDSASGKLHALKQGEIKLSVESNGKASEKSISIQ